MLSTCSLAPVASSPAHGSRARSPRPRPVAEAQVAEAQSRATIAEKKATGDIDWEQAAIENTATSWKDEFALSGPNGASDGRSTSGPRRCAPASPSWRRCPSGTPGSCSSPCRAASASRA